MFKRRARAALLASLAIPGHLCAERLSFSVYTNTEGLPQRQVLAIARDPEGYLWVGTYGGLSRFNGRSFVTLRTRHGLSSNAIQDILPLPGGRLWVATSGGGLCLVEGLKATRCLHAPRELPSEDVFCLHEDESGGLWAGTFEGVAYLPANGPPRQFRTAGGEPLRNVFAIEIIGKRVLLGHARGLAEVVNGDVRPVSVANLTGPVWSLLVVPPWLYVGTENGLYRLPESLTGAAEPLVQGVFVQNLSSDGKNLWAATRSGLLSWDGTGLRRIGPEHGLLSPLVHRVLLDREGVLWAGTDEGLVKLASSPFVTFTKDDGLPHSFVRALAEDASGRLWVGTRGGLAVFERDRFRRVFSEELPGQRVYSILPLPENELWVATNGGTAVIREGRVAKVYRESEGLPDRFTFTLAFNPRTSEVWLGTWSGTACVRRGVPVPLPPEIAAARPLTLHVDRQGRLWLGLRDGKVMVWDRQHPPQVLGSAEGLSDQVVWSMASDDTGVWLGTNGDGAFHVGENGVTRWDTSRGLVDDFIWQVLVDRRRRVWLYTSQGLDRLEDGRIKHFGVRDGLPDLEGSANACLETRQGTLWFGTGSGLLRFTPKEEQPPPDPPPILLESAAFGDGQPLTSGSMLPPKPGVVRFSLVSLGFRNEKSLHFSYRLFPVQLDWSPPQPQGEVTFAGLGPGSYRFEAVAVDADGQRSPQPVSVAFTVARPWWHRPWFFACLVVLAVAATWGASRVLVARAQARAAQLERLVAERTQELAEKNEQLARLAETDELTGLANRRKFFQTLESELKRLWRAPKDARLALLLVDLDGFKTINDTLGHTAGDVVLKSVARAMANSVRVTDTVARIGGDEFAVILPMTDRGGAAVVARKILEAVASLGVPFAGHTLSVTATAGMAVVAPSAPFSEQEVTRLLQRADVALYAAKRRGGNFFLDDEETWA